MLTNQRGYHFPIIVGEFRIKNFWFPGFWVFWECRHYASSHPACFCYPNRYVAAAVVGAITAGIQYLIARDYGSVSVFADAFHSCADASSYALIALLVLGVRITMPRIGGEVSAWVDTAIEKINGVFLILAVPFIAHEIYGRVTGVPLAISPAWVMAGGAIGFVGNWLQHEMLGEDVAHGMHKSHESTHKHIENDRIYSAVVFFGGAGMLLGLSPLFDVVFAGGLAGKMLWDAWGMLHHESREVVVREIRKFFRRTPGRNPYDRY